jgi:hypothetical protein
VTARIAPAVDVTACGQVVPAGEVGSLVGDLNCLLAPSGSNAVVLQHRAHLQLNGNSILSPVDGACVSCAGTRCTVSGPGALLSNLLTPGRGIVAVKHVTVDGSLDIDSHSVGISAPEGRVTATDTVLSNNGDGVVAKKVKGTNLFVRDSTAVGITALAGIRGEHIELRDNGVAGIQTKRFKITELIASTNGMASTTVGGGIVATGRGILIDSLISANTLAGMSADVVTGRKPLLINSTCDASVVLTDTGPAGTWGVCSSD